MCFVSSIELLLTKSWGPLAAGLIAGLIGCTHEIDYEYISLTGEIEVAEYGAPAVTGIFDHSEMPIRYRLERDNYIIHARYDEAANRPTVWFSAESSQGEKLSIQVAPIPCYASEDSWRSDADESKGFPPDGVKLTWALGKVARPCDQRPSLSEIRKVIRVSVFDREGKVGQEEIGFQVKKNGRRKIVDSV